MSVTALAMHRSFTGFAGKLPSSFNPVATMEVKRVITELKSKHSCSLDGISARILELCPGNIALILAHIFNLSLSEEVFLKAFKQAKVILVFKKGSTYDVNNYRPIS